MKNLIKELANREGLKSQVKIGDLRETVSKLQDMLAEESVDAVMCDLEGKAKTHPLFTADFSTALVKKCNAILKKKKVKVRYQHINMLIKSNVLSESKQIKK